MGDTSTKPAWQGGERQAEMTTILVKYVGPTNTKQSRMVASVVGGDRKLKAVVPFDHEIGAYGTARKAACELIRKLAKDYPSWADSAWTGGSFGNDYAFMPVRAVNVQPDMVEHPHWPFRLDAEVAS